MTNSKIERARTIIAFAMSLDAEHGCNTPARGTAGGLMARHIQIDKRCAATVTPAHRVGLGRHYEAKVGQRFFPDPDCRIFELHVYDKPVLVANLQAEDLELHIYNPGSWEGWFGIDNEGDNVPHDPWLFADERSPQWKELKQSADFQVAPLRMGPQLPPPLPMLSRRQNAEFRKSSFRQTASE